MDRSSWQSGALRFFKTSVILIPLAACDVGGGGGGGPSSIHLPERSPIVWLEQSPDPIYRGRQIYQTMGCTLCHGEDGIGGVANPHSDTGGMILGLTLMKEGFTAEQLEEKIAEGVLEVGKEKRNGPIPPFRMPAYAHWLRPDEISDLGEYLFSLYPDDRTVEDDWDE